MCSGVVVTSSVILLIFNGEIHTYIPTYLGYCI